MTFRWESMRVWLGAGQSGRTWTQHLFFTTASSLSCIETRTWVAATVLQEGHEPSVQHTNALGQRWIQRKTKKSVKVDWIVASSVSFEDLVITMHSPWPEIHWNLKSCFIGWSKYVAFVSRPTRPARLGNEGVLFFALGVAVSLRHPPGHLSKSNSIQIFTSHLWMQMHCTKPKKMQMQIPKCLTAFWLKNLWKIFRLLAFNERMITRRAGRFT